MPYLDLSYIHRGKTAKREAHETLGYNHNRPGSDNEEGEGRILFGTDGKPMSEKEALELIENASKNTLFWKMILSPDPNSENKDKLLDLQQLTDDLVRYLKKELKRPIPYIGVVHNNTDIPHVHAIILIERFGREMLITKKRIEALKKLAAGQALEQQRNRLTMQPLAASLIEVREQAQHLMTLRRQQHLGVGAGGGREGSNRVAGMVRATPSGGGRGSSPPLCEDCLKPLRKGHWKVCEKRREKTYHLKV
jgi:hypothetical protein